MKKYIDNLIKNSLNEADDVDIITQTNQILNHNMRTLGFGWIKQAPIRDVRVAEIFDEIPKEVDNVGDFKRDLDEAVQEASVPQAVEQNVNDPRVVSTNPEFNLCPAYLNGTCRVNGRACAYSNLDFKDCGIFTLAKSGLPELFEIPPGREQDMAYIKGIKDK